MKQKKLIDKLEEIKKRNQAKVEIRKELFALKQEIDAHFKQSVKIIKEGLSDEEK